MRSVLSAIAVKVPVRPGGNEACTYDIGSRCRSNAGASKNTRGIVRNRPTKAQLSVTPPGESLGDQIIRSNGRTQI